ncbi:cytochrome P450 [Rhizoctonia solani]|nr:cytochrome P450 [Rhizoctonia solani]
MPDKPLLVGLTMATGLLAYKLYRDKQGGEPELPPSPRSYPLIGHLLSVPKDDVYLGYMRLGEELASKIFSLSVFGTTIVVLNDIDDAVNLFDKRSATYSDRTCPPMAQPLLLDWGEFGSLIGYGDRWRKYRRLMNPWLNKQTVVEYRASQEQATRALLKRLLETPEKTQSSHDLEAELYQSISATLFHSLYGHKATSSDDPLLVRTQKLIAYFAHATSSSSHYVNSVPVLRYIPEWFPGAGWKREAVKWRKEKDSLIDEIYSIGLENTTKAEGARPMVQSLRTQALKLGFTEEEADNHVKQICITLVGEVQKKAQEELDSVIGNTRLPSVEDRSRLKYIEMVMQELFRWAPVTPIALPHTCYRDDTYKGYHIPKGAIVIGNAWAMTRDPSVYEDPEVFNPDRYLDPCTPPSPVFGWGRRRCPGVHFAQASVFVAIASILMTFDIGVAQDENGKDIIPSGKLVNSIVLTPEPFMFKLTSRSAIHEELIRDNC